MSITTWILSSIILILVILLGIAIYGLYNSARKIMFYEEWYAVFEEHVVGMKQEIERIDELGAFEADDEVGYFFKALKEMVNDLYEMGFYETTPEDQG